MVKKAVKYEVMTTIRNDLHVFHVLLSWQTIAGGGRSRRSRTSLVAFRPFVALDTCGKCQSSVAERVAVVRGRLLAVERAADKRGRHSRRRVSPLLPNDARKFLFYC